MNHRVQHRFTQCGHRYRPALDTLQPIVADPGSEVLGLEHLKSLVDLENQAARYLILVAQVYLGFEIADLQIRASEETLWFGMKHESGSAGQIAAFYEMQLFQKILIRLLENTIRQALTISRQTAKSFESAGV
jgi:hypothetical protein